MANEINLLLGQKKAIFIDVYRPLKIGTVIFLVFYCLVSLAVISYFTYLDISRGKIDQEIEIKKNQIARLRKVESLALMNNQRLSSLSQFFSQKKTDMPAIMTKIKDLAGDNVSLTQIKMDSGGSLNVSATTTHPLYFADFYERLGKEKGFPSLSLSLVSRDNSGNYRFDLVVKLW